ncbi:uncharacterized protein LOC130900974 [Diorhabda carinulata]|uniref:uncharacterized protein LOC130900974 n=1 Tax=Diorhabda carinulata TaxID=1163345 RepID=UPI0025A04DD7|nr:uncharacterized protein LOC130900974 [Diorhabda carinulata]
MKNKLLENVKLISFKKKRNKKCASKIKNKQIGNSKRHIRRKQTKIKYYKNLKKKRLEKTTHDLCSQVQVINMDDVDWISNNGSKPIPAELIEWHRQDQLAYWKARAITLELENNMLKEHLRNMYSQVIRDGVYNKAEEKPGNNKKINKEDKSQIMDVTEANLPDPDMKNRLEEMRRIYGDAAEKIMAMETAVQLNYERHFEQNNPIFWPVLPLRMKFK